MATHDSNFEHAVRETAYFLWEKDGRPDGRDQEYWFAALEQHRDLDTTGLNDHQDLEARTGRQVDDNIDDLGRKVRDSGRWSMDWPAHEDKS